MKTRTRFVGLAMSVPMALFAYNPLHAMASTTTTPTCDGLAATKVVTAHSPHTVYGTQHRDVIVIKNAGHVVYARRGSDVICGSPGHDVIRAGAGNDVVRGRGGNDTISGGPG